MKVKFHPEAEAELNEALQYFSSISDKLRIDFTTDAKVSVERMKCHPTSWTLIEKNIRRIRMKQFSYGIIYEIQTTGIMILAIAHSRRAPDYWKHRVSK